MVYISDKILSFIAFISNDFVTRVVKCKSNYKLFVEFNPINNFNYNYNVSL